MAMLVAFAAGPDGRISGPLRGSDAVQSPACPRSMSRRCIVLAAILHVAFPLLGSALVQLPGENETTSSSTPFAVRRPSWWRFDWTSSKRGLTLGCDFALVLLFHSLLQFE